MAKATRPLFIPDTKQLVKDESFEFEWFMGMARSQKQKNVESLHKKIREVGYSNILEISTYSPEPIGVKLSAFNLLFKKTQSPGTVENLYQKSKIFGDGNDSDMIGRQNPKGLQPISFEFDGYKWPLEPLSAFYDWLYVNALHQDSNLSKSVLKFQGFTDIAYNPKKALSTQARSAALYITLVRLNKIDQIKDQGKFLKLIESYDYMREEKTLFT